jgi:hypothetical protein
LKSTLKAENKTSEASFKAFNVIVSSRAASEFNTAIWCKEEFFVLQANASAKIGVLS